MAGNDVIREYLISLSYKVDQGSESKFFKSITSSVTSFKGLEVAAFSAAAAITASVLKISSTMDSLYFVSLRTKASAENLTAFGYAATQMGISSDSAASSVEAFASKLRNFPNMRILLNNLGVKQSGDPIETLMSLHKQLASMPQWLQLRYANLVGVDEKLWLQMDRIEKFYNQRKADARRIGVDYDVATKAGNKLWEALRRVWGIVEDISVKLSTGVIKVLGVNVEQLAQAIINNSDRIQAVLGNLFTVISSMSAAFGLKLLLSPFGLVLGMITAVLLLIDDYTVWQKNKAGSLFDWGMFDKITKAMDDFNKSFLHLDEGTAHWVTNLEKALGILLSIAALRWVFGAILGAGGAAAGGAAAGGAAAGAAGGGVLSGIFGGSIIGFLLKRLLPGAAIAGGLYELQKYSEEHNQSFGDTLKEFSGVFKQTLDNFMTEWHKFWDAKFEKAGDPPNSAGGSIWELVFGRKPPVVRPLTLAGEGDGETIGDRENRNRPFVPTGDGKTGADRENERKNNNPPFDPAKMGEGKTITDLENEKRNKWKIYWSDIGNAIVYGAKESTDYFITRIEGWWTRVGPRFAPGASTKSLDDFGKPVPGTGPGEEAGPDKVSREEKLKRAGRIAAVWTKLGWTPAEVAAGLSSMEGESSSFDAQQKGDYDKNGNPTSFGVMQLHGDRIKRFHDWSGGQDIRFASLEKQAEFVDYELHHQEWDRAGKRFFSPTATADEKSKIFTGGYERPLDPAQMGIRARNVPSWFEQAVTGFHGSYGGQLNPGGPMPPNVVNQNITISISGSGDPNHVANLVVREINQRTNIALATNGRSNTQ